MQIDSKTVQTKRHTLSVLIISFRAWDSLWSLKLARKWVEPSVYLNFWPIFAHPALNALEKYKWAWTVTFALNSILWSIGGRFNPHLAKNVARRRGFAQPYKKNVRVRTARFWFEWNKGTGPEKLKACKRIEIFALDFKHLWEIIISTVENQLSQFCKTNLRLILTPKSPNALAFIAIS